MQHKPTDSIPKTSHCQRATRETSHCHLSTDGMERNRNGNDCEANQCLLLPRTVRSKRGASEKKK